MSNPIRTVKDLAGLRDEVRLQLHLANTEAKAQWHEAERTWEELQSRLQIVQDSAELSLDQLEEAGRLLAEEANASYRRVWEAIQQATS